MEYQEPENGKYFPPFCQGEIYIMTPNTAAKIYSAFLQTRHQVYLWLEDIYITGGLRGMINATIFDISPFRRCMNTFCWPKTFGFGQNHQFRVWPKPLKI